VHTASATDTLSLLLEQAPCIVWSTDTDLRFLSAHGAALRLIEPRGVNAVGRSLLDFFPPDHEAVDAHRRAAAGETVVYRTTLQGRTFNSRVQPLLDLWGDIQGCLGVAFDITERVEAERVLHRDALVLANIWDAVIVTDLSGHITYWNKGATKLFGWSAEEMLDRHYADRFQEPMRSWIRHQIATRGAGIDWDGEFEDGRKDGSRVWIDSRVRRITDEHGTAVGILAISRDITERKKRDLERAEQFRVAGFVREISLALVREGSVRAMLQACASAMVDHLGAALARIWTVEPPDAVLQLQASAGTHTHAEDTHLRHATGQHLIDTIAHSREPYLTNDLQNDPRTKDSAWAAREGLLAFGGYPLIVDDRLVGVFAMFAREPLSEVVLEALGSVAYAIAGAVQRKRSEATATLLNAIVEGSEDAILSVGLDGTITSWNRGAEHLYGYSADEVIGRPLEVFLSREETKEVRESLDSLRRGGRIGPIDARRTRKDGRIVQVTLSMSPIRDSAGRLVGASAIGRDVTDRKHLEEQFRQAQKMEAVGRLAGGVAHDFNNLLTIINGYTQELLDNPRASDATPMLEQIARAGERAAALTQQLLAYSRRQMLQPEVIDLNALVTDAGSMLRRIIGEDVDLLTRLDPGLPRVKADRGQMNQVLLNLCVNARDAMPTGGRLTIETRAATLDRAAARPLNVSEGTYARLTVSDTGCGMDADTQSHIFEPFFTTKPTGQGTGLGLATVYGIVKQSNGCITVHSEPHCGSTFHIYLPACAAREVAVQVTHVPTRGTETVLLVEDEGAVRRLAERALTRAGYTVLAASRGDEALQRVTTSSQPIDLLVSDVVMPGMSGRELADRLRARDPQLRVLFVSGYSEELVERHGVSGDDAAFLHKPFLPLDLTRAVRDALDSR
jgi:two-component system, cell cycle sensor histidine kinase and response regulator CckA